MVFVKECSALAANRASLVATFTAQDPSQSGPCFDIRHPSAAGRPAEKRFPASCLAVRLRAGPSAGYLVTPSAISHTRS